MRTVRFHPQAWLNDNAIEVDAEGPVEFEVEDDVITPSMTNDSYESDELRDHENAPDWIKDWSGPFWIEIEFLGEPL